MRLLLEVCCGECGSSFCDYAIVEIDEIMARQIAVRHKILQELEEEDDQTSSIHFHNSAVTFYRLVAETSEDLQEILDKKDELGEDQVEIPDDLDLSFLTDLDDDGDHIHLSGNSDVLVIEPRCFYWIFHTDEGDVTTTSISYNILSKLI